jgi:hypothetical protein
MDFPVLVSTGILSVISDMKILEGKMDGQPERPRVQITN